MLKPTMVQLPVEMIERLDARAARGRESRSQVIRQAIAAFLATEGDEGLAARYAEAYARAPLDQADDWGDVEGWHRGLEQARAGGRDARDDWP